MDIHAWMTSKKQKTQLIEVMLFGTRTSLEKFDMPHPKVAGTVLQSLSITWGVMFDSAMSMASQINKTIKIIQLHFRNIGLVRKNLTEASTKSF